MSKFQLLLAIRCRIEYLEYIFDVPPSVHRRKDKWNWILKQEKEKRVNIILDHLNKRDIEKKDFVKAITVIYGDFSDPATHGVMIPKTFSERTVTEIVHLLEVHREDFIEDDLIEKSLHIIIELFKE